MNTPTQCVPNICEPPIRKSRRIWLKKPNFPIRMQNLESFGTVLYASQAAANSIGVYVTVPPTLAAAPQKGRGQSLLTLLSADGRAAVESLVGNGRSFFETLRSLPIGRRLSVSACHWSATIRKNHVRTRKKETCCCAVMGEVGRKISRMYAMLYLSLKYRSSNLIPAVERPGIRVGLLTEYLD